MLDLAKAIAAVEATRQLVITLTPHLRTLATQVRPLVAPAPKALLAPGLGALGIGIAIGAGVGLLAAPQTGAQARAKLKEWIGRGYVQAVAVRKRLLERRSESETEPEQPAIN